MADRRVPPCAVEWAHCGRAARRHLRPQEDFPHRLGRVHPHVLAVWCRGGPSSARALPCAARTFRSSDAPAGAGFALSSLFNIVLAAVEPHETGSASGTFTAVQQFAGALGVAVLGTVYFGLLGEYTVAFRQTLWAVGVLLVFAFAAAYLLPKARTSWEVPSQH